jgi:hypothetical protein
MKKQIFYILCSTCILFSCTDILNTTPRSIITDQTLWGNKNAIDAYLGNVYDQMPTEDFNYSVGVGIGYESQYTDEATRAYTWGNNDPILKDDAFDWWGYTAIHDVNYFIEDVQKASVLTDSEIKQYVAEARFVRAFDYFSMVKRYGGVPLITKVQDYDGDISKLYVARNTEKEIYDFIKSECDDIVNILPSEQSSGSKYRATKWAAYALKCRAMLYAASEAKYGTVQLNGLVGIEQSAANGYWKEAENAAESIMESGKFSLYNQYPNDKEKNFEYLFLDKNNSEQIFTKAFSAPDKTHNFDFFNAPQSFKVDWGCLTNPTEDLVSEYENIDGTSTPLAVNDANGNPIKYSDPMDLFKNKDPRLKATVLLPFCSWQGGKVEIRSGIILPDGSTKTASNFTDTYGEGSNSIAIIGKDGSINTGDATKTGFYIKKFMDPINRVSYQKGETNWMIFRYGEVLLNYAEACVELGETAKATDALNQIRTRAGIAKKNSITIDEIRHERKMELAFENQRWWDMRRWHIADQVLNSRAFYGLYPYLVWENGKDISAMKYIFKISLAPKETRTFLPKLYYEMIPTSAISTNPQIIQNPGY